MRLFGREWGTSPAPAPTGIEVLPDQPVSPTLHGSWQGIGGGPSPTGIQPGGPMKPAVPFNPGGPQKPAPTQVNPGGPMKPAPTQVNPGGPAEHVSGRGA